MSSDGLPRGTGWAVAVVATLAMTVSYIDRQALANLALPVCKALDMSELAYGTLPMAFSLSYLVGAPLAGRLIDRVGARRGFTVSILVWSVVSAVHALVPTFGALFGLRVALGAAEAPSFPGAAQTVRRALPRADRAAGYGLIFTGSSLGAMIAAPLAIGLNARFGWRLAFVGTSLCGLAWLPLWLVATGGRRRRALEARQEEKLPAADVPWAEVLRAPAVRRSVVLVFTTAPALMFVLTWFPKLLVQRLAQQQDDLWRYLWLPPLMLDVGAVGLGALVSRRERRHGVHRSPVDLAFLGAAFVTCLALVPLATGPAMAVTLGGLAALGGGALYSLATSDMLARVEHRVTSRAAGCTAAAQSLSYVVFGPLVGFVIDRTHSHAHVLVGLGLLALPGAVAWARWRVPTEAPRT